jgi:type I restriction enzyme S subunit
MRDGWIETTLKDALEPIANRPEGKDYPLVLSVTEKRGIIPQTEIFKHRIATDDISKYKVLEPMDIAYNPYLLWCGAIGQWTGDRPGVVSPVYECFRVKKNCSPRYLGYIFEAGILTAYFDALAIGSIVRRRRTIPKDFIAAPISLPPLPEQKRIVDLISSVDSYIEALQQQLASAKAARDAVLEEIVSHSDKNWNEVSLGEVLEISRGGSPRPIQDYLTDSDEGVNWVKIADASRSEKYIYKTLQRISRDGISRSREVFSGDFILSNSMSFGRPYIMRTDGCIHDGWLLLANVRSNFDEDFLYNLLNSDYVQRQFASLAAGSGVRNLNIDVVRKIKVWIPSIEGQRRLISVLNDFDEYILKVGSAFHATSELRGAVLSDLLSGKHEIPASYDKFMGAA